MRARVVTRDPFYAIRQAFHAQKREMGKIKKSLLTPTHPVYRPDGPLDAIETQIAFFGAKPGDPGAKPYYYWHGAWHPFLGATSWVVVSYGHASGFSPALIAGSAGFTVPFDLGGATNISADGKTVFMTNDPDLFSLDDASHHITVATGGSYRIQTSCGLGASGDHHTGSAACYSEYDSGVGAATYTSLFGGNWQATGSYDGSLSFWELNDLQFTVAEIAPRYLMKLDNNVGVDLSYDRATMLIERVSDSVPGAGGSLFIP